ncbi:unnamed protein product [Polarella glacialis]|uniref:C3H1-type domain-containing protein n=1 Tax=Polarella glacialis TaxID=89957 RepID=A0A813LVU2_POLGL|nr:unnamed protein product [Polarella glacialis]
MLCKFWGQGSCKFGDQCSYSHQGASKGGCGDFSGSSSSEVCTYFSSGQGCRFGDACRHRHDASGGKFKGAGKGRGKGDKGSSKGFPPGGGQGHGKSKGKGSFENITWTPNGSGHGKSSEPPPGTGTRPEGPPVPELKAFTGPYLGKGSELQKVWSMPDELGHNDGIQAAVVMGSRLCTGGLDQRVILWRGEQGAESLSLALDNEVGCSSAVTALLFHEGSKWLFCGQADGQIRAFRQEPLAESFLAGHSAAVTRLLVHDTALVSGSQDGTVRVWNYDDGTGKFACSATIPTPFLRAIFDIHLEPSGPTLWIGTEKGIILLSLQSLQPIRNIESAACVVRLLSYQGCILAALANGVVKIFDLAGQEQFSHGPVGEHTTNSVVALLRHPQANKDILLCGQEIGYVTAYDIPEFRPRGTFNTGYEGDVTAIVDMSGGVFATCGLTGDVVIWRWERDDVGSAQ